MLGNNFLDIFIDHFQKVNKPNHKSRSQIGHAYIKKVLMVEFPTNVIVENIYFSDHDDIRIAIPKIPFDFHTISQNSIKLGNKGKFDIFSRFFSNFNSFINLVKTVVQRVR